MKEDRRDLSKQTIEIEFSKVNSVSKALDMIREMLTNHSSSYDDKILKVKMSIYY